MQSRQVLSRRELLEIWKKERRQNPKPSVNKLTSSSSSNIANKENIKKQLVNEKNKVISQHKKSTRVHGFRDNLKVIEGMEPVTHSTTNQSLLLPQISMIQHEDDISDDEQMNQVISFELEGNQGQFNELVGQCMDVQASPIVCMPRDKGDRLSIVSDWSSLLLEAPQQTTTNASDTNDETSPGFTLSFREASDDKGAIQDNSYFLRRITELESQLKQCTKERDQWKERYQAIKKHHDDMHKFVHD